MSDLYWIIPLCVSLLAMGCATILAIWGTTTKIRYVWPFESMESGYNFLPVFVADVQNPYQAPQTSGPESSPLSNYAKERILLLDAMGFEHAHVYRSSDPVERSIRYDVWMSPAKERICVIASGR